MFGFGKRKTENKQTINISSLVRGVLLDSGLWDSNVPSDYEIINRVPHASPISEEVLERELQDSDNRRDELETIFPIIVAMSSTIVEALAANADIKREQKNGETEFLQSIIFSEESKVIVSTILSGTSIGIISQLINVKLLTKGWK